MRGGGEYERCVRPQLAWDAPVAGGLVRGFAMEATGLLGALAALYPQRTTSPAQVSEHAETLPDKQSLPRSGTLLSRQLDGALNPRAVRSVPELALVTTFWEDAFVDGQLAASHAAQLRSLHHPRGSGFEALATQQRSHVDEGGEHVSVTSRNPSGSSSAQEAQQRHNERATEADEANEARAAGPQVYVSQWTPPGFHERLDWYRARLPSHHRPFRTVARLMYETTAIPQEWHQGAIDAYFFFAHLVSVLTDWGSRTTESNLKSTKTQIISVAFPSNSNPPAPSVFPLCSSMFVCIFHSPCVSNVVSLMGHEWKCEAEAELPVILCWPGERQRQQRSGRHPWTGTLKMRYRLEPIEIQQNGAAQREPSEKKER